MSYTKQTWGDGIAGGTPINSARLNHIESGIAAAPQYLGAGTAFPSGSFAAGDTFYRTDLGGGSMWVYSPKNFWQVISGKPYCFADRATNSAAIPDATWSRVWMDHIQIDNWSAYNTTAADASNFYTAPLAGVYRVSGVGSFANTAAAAGDSIRAVKIAAQAAASGTWGDVNASAQTQPNVGGQTYTAIPTPTVLINCAKGDKITLWAFQRSGATLSLIGGTNQGTAITIELIEQTA